jgi:hypothetical protein
MPDLRGEDEVKAWELLDKPEKWTQFTNARTKTGELTCNSSDSPYSYCLTAALSYCYGLSTKERQEAVLRIMNHLSYSYHLVLWNDDPNRTWEEVHNLLKELDL